MVPIGAAAILQGGISILGSILGNSAAKVEAAKQNAYNAQVTAIQEAYRTKQMEYETEVYKRDIDYRRDVQKFQNTEFTRQVEFVDTARENMEENYFNKVGTLLVRAFEEQIASTFERQEVQSQGRAARATVNATLGERNIDGNTARQLEGELFRQEGESLVNADLNDQARERQGRLDIMGLKAEHDSNVGRLQLQANSPLAPLNKPPPVAPVVPAKQVSGPSKASLGIDIASGALNAVGGYMKANNIRF